MERKMNYGLALLRMLMCFEVVLVHFWNDSDYSSVLTPFMLLRDYAVPIFILMSFILGEKIFDRLENANIGRRLWRLFWPQFAWAIIYWSIFNLVYLFVGIGSKHGINSLFWQIITGHSKALNPTMWYTTVLIILTVLFYYIWKYQNGVNGIRIMCILLIISLILQYTKINVFLFGNLRYEMKYPLGRTVELLPYAVIGFLIMYYKVYERLLGKRYIILSGAFVLFSGLFLFRNRIERVEGFNYAGIHLVLMSVLITLIAYFFPLEKISKKLQKFICFMTQYTLGIYCMHRLVGTYLSVLFEHWGMEKGTFLMCVVIYIVCYIISMLISYIPIRGFKQLVK